MDLKEILSVSGKPGLFKTIAQTKTGVIIESLTDGKRIQAFASDKISSLGEISIFTKEEDLPLREVFRLIQEKNADQPAPDAKSDDNSIKAFFESIVPDYDHERVYVSHMRKVTSWYNMLLVNGITDFSAPAETASEDAASPGEASEPVEEK
ncbi:MAG: DUF5606 domain-containing protein [Bacteroidota bacterium]